MKKYAVFLLMFYCSAFLAGCDMATPEKYFDVAVLNSNRVAGFAGNSLSRELESPSVMLDANGKQVVIKRQSLVEEYTRFTEEVLSRLGKFSKTEDNKDIVSSSEAMYNYMLPVYKKEYTALAKLYDDGGTKEQTEAMDTQIKTTYGPKFKELYHDLISKGKLYAARHKIPVNWAE